MSTKIPPLRRPEWSGPLHPPESASRTWFASFPLSRHLGHRHRHGMECILTLSNIASLSLCVAAIIESAKLSTKLFCKHCAGQFHMVRAPHTEVTMLFVLTQAQYLEVMSPDLATMVHKHLLRFSLLEQAQAHTNSTFTWEPSDVRRFRPRLSTFPDR